MSNIKINAQGKTALVTGSNRGIGKAITEELLKRGVKKVYAGARNVESLNELKVKYGDRVVALQLDVTDDQSVSAAASQVQDLDILVNNAGVLIPGGVFSDQAFDALEKNYDVNVLGLLRVSRSVVDQLKGKPEAAIVNVASVVGLASMPLGATYSLTKAAVHSISQSMRGELAEENILISTVYPGPIDTDMTRGFEMDKDSPENVALNVLNGVEEGVEDIFPDSMSSQFGKTYYADPKSAEKHFLDFV